METEKQAPISASQIFMTKQPEENKEIVWMQNWH